MIETVSAIHRVLARGSSFPSVVETTPGVLRVMKLAGAGPGSRALAMEHFALELARRLGLNVPRAVVLRLTPELPWQVGTDEFYETVQRSAGLNLGIDFIACAADLRAADLSSLPQDFLDRMGAVDALLQNADRTEANPNVVRDATGTPWAIDFGACLLIDRLARGALEPRLELLPGHFMAHQAALAASAARTLAAEIDGADLHRLVDMLPEPWLDELELTRCSLTERLVRYFESLRGPLSASSGNR